MQKIFNPLKGIKEIYRVQLDQIVNDKDVNAALIDIRLFIEALLVSMRTLDGPLPWWWRKSEAFTLAGIHKPLWLKGIELDHS